MRSVVPTMPLIVFISVFFSSLVPWNTGVPLLFDCSLVSLLLCYYAIKESVSLLKQKPLFLQNFSWAPLWFFFFLSCLPLNAWLLQTSMCARFERWEETLPENCDSNPTSRICTHTHTPAHSPRSQRNEAEIRVKLWTSQKTFRLTEALPRREGHQAVLFIAGSSHLHKLCCIAIEMFVSP